MTDPVIHPAVSTIINLLLHYGFEQQEASAKALVDQWLQTYPLAWVRLALIEALYQGRYKSVSVEQFLVFWQRRGQPCHHFSHEFERLVCNNLPQKLHNLPALPENSSALQPLSKPTPKRLPTAVSLPFAPSPRPNPNVNGAKPSPVPKSNGKEVEPITPLDAAQDQADRMLPVEADFDSLPLKPEPSSPLIDQFRPVSKPSGIHSKLTAFAKGQVALPPRSAAGKREQGKR